MKNYIILLFVLLLFSMYSNAQKKQLPGYILKQNNDTVYGFIKNEKEHTNAKHCYFTVSPENKFQSFNPFDIKEYRISNGRYYVSKEIIRDNKVKHVFLEYLMKGIVSLYYLKETIEEYYYIEKNGELIELSNDEVQRFDQNGVEYRVKSNQYTGVLRLATNDCPEFSKNINHVSFGHNSLIKATMEYHNLVCEDYACVDYTKKQKQYILTDVYLTPYIGISIDNMSELGRSENYTKQYPYFGIDRINLSNGVRHIWGYTFGFQYSYCKYDFLPYEDVSRSSFCFPFKLLYGLKLWELKLSFLSGVNTKFINEKSITKWTHIENTEYQEYKYRFAVILGADLNYILDNKNEIGLSFSYSNEISYDHINHKLFNIGINYSFYYKKRGE